MPLPKRLQRFTTPTPVLDDGHVQLVDVMGDDLDIVDAARVSFFGHSSESTEAQNRHLLRHLMRERHTTPFEMCELKIRVRVPMDAWRQWIRHRTANVNESSTRYAPAIDSAQKVEAWRSQSKDNKQGSSGLVDAWPEGFYFPEPVPVANHQQLMDAGPGAYLSAREAEAQAFARKVYEERITLGVAREQARKDLPLSTYTEAYWKMDLHNLFHFLGLRLDSHAQAEIRAYAEAIAEIVKVWVPWAWEAFNDYRLEAMYLSRQEVEGLQAILAQYRKDVATLWAEAGHGLGDPTVPEQAAAHITRLALGGAGVKGREKKEFTAKISRLLTPSE